MPAHERRQTIVHGDYRLGNMALDREDPGRVVAIFDWEMSTLGDPLADLGYTLIYWVEAGEGSDVEGTSITTAPGFFTRAEIVEAYARASGRDVSAVDFYQVLALTKLAVISEGIYKRFTLGKTLGEGFEGLKRMTAPLARARPRHRRGLRRSRSCARRSRDSRAPRRRAQVRSSTQPTARPTRVTPAHERAARRACGARSLAALGQGLRG